MSYWKRKIRFVEQFAHIKMVGKIFGTEHEGNLVNHNKREKTKIHKIVIDFLSTCAIIRTH